MENQDNTRPVIGQASAQFVPPENPVNTAVATASVPPIPRKINLVSLLIRIGLIFVFAWAAIFILITPEKYLHYMPSFVGFIMPREIALYLFSFYEIFLCIWLATGKKTFYSGIVTAVTIAALTVVNYGEIGTLFRNVSIFFSSLALAFTKEND